MGFFHLHRSSSSSSARSASSAYSSASSYGTPRSSTDSADDFMTATIKPHLIPARAPFLDLPFEILQHVASFLDDASASALSLSNRHICYAIGTSQLSNYISSSPSRLDARDRLEATIERALPGSWHCAWCDKFHPWSTNDTPTTSPPLQPPCAEYNSSLSSPGYTLRYSHLRLALAHHRHGPSHGLPLSAFTHTSSSSTTLFHTHVQTRTSHAAKIVNGTFLLHTTLSLLLPSWTTPHKSLIDNLWPVLPPALTQHRATPHGHSGLMAALDNVVRRGWRVRGAQTCADCATQWSVSAFKVPRSVAGEFVRLDVQTWRDLGTGGSPFDSVWRTHGPYLPGSQEYGVRGRGSGDGVREAFEGAGEGGEGEGVEGREGQGGDLAYSWLVDRKREVEREEEQEWRAIWKYIERRASVEKAGG